MEASENTAREGPAPPRGGSDSGSGIASNTSNLERWLGVFLVGGEREARYLCSAPPDSTPIPLAAVVTRNKNMLYFFSLPVFSFQGIIPWIDLGHSLACREDACCA